MVWDGSHHRGMSEFLGCSSAQSISAYNDNFYISHGRVEGGLIIKTSEGDMAANIGDYIIKETFDKERGFYPWKPDIFLATYEEVEEMTGSIPPNITEISEHTVTLIIDLLEDTLSMHSHTGSIEYCGCDKDPCLWCENAKAVLSELPELSTKGRLRILREGGN